MAGKRITDQTLIGQTGINLIEKRVLEMGWLWYPTGGIEAGIDGLIELRNPVTGEALNSIIQVQSKATRGAFQGETPKGIEYLCSEKDLAYWLAGNAPIILVCSRPDTDEAYWVSIKDHFKDPIRKKSRKIYFDKKRDSFDATAVGRLTGLAVPRDVGIYFAAPPSPERLYSNLLTIVELPARIYLADTGLRYGSQVAAHLKDAGSGGVHGWVFRGKRILSFHNLSERPWMKIVDLGTAESFDTEEWAGTEDADRTRDFVELLNRCLRAQIGRHGIRYDENREYYFFEASAKLTPRRVSYLSMTRGSSRIVFQAYRDERDPGRVKYYRHSAVHAHFRRYGEDWYLELTPTYHFTFDGRRRHGGYETKLKGIKALEKNAAVLGQVVMWSDLLAREDGLFGDRSRHLIRFGMLVSFDLGVGINEKLWLESEEDAETKAAAAHTATLPLFDDETLSGGVGKKTGAGNEG